MTHKSIFAKKSAARISPCRRASVSCKLYRGLRFLWLCCGCYSSEQPTPFGYLPLVVRSHLTLCHLIYEPKNHNRICGMIAKKVRMWYAMKKKPPESRCSTRLSGVSYCHSKFHLACSGQKFLSCARSYFLLLFPLNKQIFSLNFL